MPQLDDLFALEVSIGADDRVGIDQQILRHPADARELLTRLDGTRFDRMLQVFDELQIQRRAGRGIEAQRGQLCALSIQYTGDASLTSRACRARLEPKSDRYREAITSDAAYALVCASRAGR